MRTTLPPPSLLALLGCTPPARAAGEVSIALALPRTEYTIAEPVELALHYPGGDAKSIPLEVRHADGSALALEVPLAAGGKAHTRLITLRPGVLKPGRYTAATRLGK